MLFNLLAPLSEELNPLNVFRYQTFRSGSAILFVLSLLLSGGQVGMGGLGEFLLEPAPSPHHQLLNVRIH